MGEGRRWDTDTRRTGARNAAEASPPVRRLLETVGHPVRWLRRVRFGPIRLGELPRGAWRELGDAEVEALRAVAAPPRTVRE